MAWEGARMGNYLRVMVAVLPMHETGSIPGSGRSPGGGNGNSLQYSCLKNPMDRGAWGAMVHGVTKSQTWLSDLAEHTAAAKSLQSCATLCDPTDHSPPGSYVHGSLQKRILEWAAMPSSRRSSWPRDRTQVFCISCIAGRFFTHCTTWEAQYLYIVVCIC